MKRALSILLAAVLLLCSCSQAGTGSETEPAGAGAQVPDGAVPEEETSPETELTANLPEAEPAAGRSLPTPFLPCFPEAVAAHET